MNSRPSRALNSPRQYTKLYLPAMISRVRASSHFGNVFTCGPAVKDLIPIETETVFRGEVKFGMLRAGASREEQTAPIGSVNLKLPSSQADIAALLVNADFLASEFITSNEIAQLVQAAKRRACTVIPIIVRPHGPRSGDENSSPRRLESIMSIQLCSTTGIMMEEL